MRTWLVAAVALGVSAPAMTIACAAVDEGPRVQRAGIDTGFPNYSKEDETKSCAFGYGTENSSILDCVTRDETYRVTLAKAWPGIDDRFRKDCVGRLSHRKLNSYFYLDRCIQSLKHDAAATPE